MAGTMFGDERVLSRPMRVVWDGWETTTTQLQQRGWELTAEQDFRYRAIRLAMRNRTQRMYGVTDLLPYDFFDQGFVRGYGAQPVFQVVYMASEIVANVPVDFSKFAAIDAMPQFVNSERKSIEDFGIFATPLVRTEEIIVEPQTVASLLEQIKKLQVPEQAAIRQRNRARDVGESPRPREQFHAQILSIAA